MDYRHSGFGASLAFGLSMGFAVSASEERTPPTVEFFEWLPVLISDGGNRGRSSGRSINNSGQVTGVAGGNAFLWDGENFETIASPGFGWHINNAGQVLGTEASGLSVWDGGWRSLGGLEFPLTGPLYTPSYNPTGLNDASTAVGTASSYLQGNQAWLAPPGGSMQPVPLPISLSATGSHNWESGGIAINNYGDLVLSGNSNEGTDQFPDMRKWRILRTAEGTEFALPNEYGHGESINNKFQVLFSQNVLYSIGSETAVFIDESPYVGPSARTDRRMSIEALSNSGLIVGEVFIEPYDDQSPVRSNTTRPHRAAAVWMDDVTYHLKDLVIGSGLEPELAGGFLEFANGVSDNGWITGAGEMSDGLTRAFLLKLMLDPVWAQPVDGVFSIGDNWTTGVAPAGGSDARFDVPGAYTVSFGEPAEHGRTAVFSGDVAFALNGNDYRLEFMQVQSTDGEPVYARVVGRLDFEDGISPLPLPDGRLTTQEAFVGPRGTLANAGTLLVGDVFLQDYETPATRDGTDVDLHVVNRLRIAAGGTVTGSGLEYGAIVDGEGNTGRVEIEGLNASMNSFRIDVGGVHGGRIDVAGGGLLESRTALVVGAEGDGAAEVRVSGFAVDFDGRIVNSAVEASLIALGDVNLVRVDERSGALWAYDRGRVSADDILVGVSAGTRGEFDVRGEGTRVGGLVTSHTLLEVGYGGEGLMVIRDGAQVFANTTIGGFRTPPGDFEIGSGVIPDPEIGEGTVFITGQGADTPDAFNTLLDSPLLLVGDTGLGELVISDGARVLSNRILLGQYITGEGSVTVQGAGSLLELSFEGADEDIDFDFPAPELWVGKAGKGALLVRDGGSVVIDPDNGGVIHVEDGRIEVRNGGSVTSGTVNIGPDAVVVGDAGSWNVAEGHTMLHGGRFEIGASPGRFLIDGNLTLLDTSWLEIEFAGLPPGLFDILDVTGDLRLGGTLALSFIDDFVPQPDDVFSFLNVGGVIEGSFDQVLMSNLALGLDYDIAWKDGELQMRMQGANGFAPIPIPPAGWLLMSAFGLLAVFRWRGVQKCERV